MEYFVDRENHFYIGLRVNRRVVFNLVPSETKKSGKTWDPENYHSVFFAATQSGVVIMMFSTESLSSQAKELYVVSY